MDKTENYNAQNNVYIAIWRFFKDWKGLTQLRIIYWEALTYENLYYSVPDEENIKATPNSSGKTSEADRNHNFKSLDSIEKLLKGKTEVQYSEDEEE